MLMVCVEQHLYIRKTVINLESAKPAVYQPSDRLDGREVDKGVVCSLSHYGLVQSCHAVSFIVPNKQQMALQEKRQKNDDDLQLCT